VRNREYDQSSQSQDQEGITAGDKSAHYGRVMSDLLSLDKSRETDTKWFEEKYGATMAEVESWQNSPTMMEIFNAHYNFLKIKIRCAGQAEAEVNASLTSFKILLKSIQIRDAGSTVCTYSLEQILTTNCSGFE